MSQFIEKLHFSLDDGLVRVTNKPSARLPIDESQIILEVYAINPQIDFIFFRRFTDRASQPVAFIIDNTSKKFRDIDLAKLHRDLWFYGRIPLLYVEWEDHVDILNCHSIKNSLTRKRVWEYTVSDQLFNDLFEISEKLSRYSMFRLADGTFWEDSQNSSFLDEKNSSYHILIEKIKLADENINGSKNQAARKLLLLALLIKYLEDRKVFISGDKNWFSQFDDDAKSFLDVLKTKSTEKIAKLFNELENKFNGDIFSFPESDKITKKVINSLIHLGEKNEDETGQLYFWDIFSFEHIPVEVLSHIYQHFTQKEKGAIFTPTPLVELILDYTMPYSKLSGSEKILDPTCGSGIFLVSAFRRLIFVAQRNKKWEKLNPDELKGLLGRSIFGIELQKEAAQITAFSLALAICDALRPEIIWKELKFDKLLGKNIIADDFGKVTKKKYPKFVPTHGIDIIIGNPPFLSELSDSIREELQNETIPDKQLAYYILKESMERYLSESGVICMIQPQGFLYNQRSKNYRIDFLNKYTVHTILDFVSIRGVFHGADTKVIVIKANKKQPDTSHMISHLTFRRTETAKRQLYFELDYYDYHTVSQNDAIIHDFVWRANLLGGGRIFSIAKRLKTLDTIQDFLDKKKWKANEGFIIGEKDLKPEDQCKFLLNQYLLTEESFSSNKIKKDKLGVVKTKRFTSPRSKEIYQSPIMIIAKVDKLNTGLWEDGFLAYNQSYIALNRIPAKGTRGLKQFFNCFNEQKSILCACICLFSSHALSSQATVILKSDIMNLPWPQDGNFDIVPWENEILSDISEYMVEYVRLGQDSKLLLTDVSKNYLDEYTETFLRLIRKYFKNTERSHSLSSNGLILIAFTFSGKKELEWLENSEWETTIHNLIDKEQSKRLHTKRIVRILTGNSLILIKPSKLRYWIRSTAVRDVDDIVDQILHNGENL